jgi:hypothetical protein
VRNVKWHMLLAAAAGALALAPVAGADPPDLPDQPGYVPGAPDTEPGSFSYPYNVIAVGPPPATDSRGVRISSSVDKVAQSTGLPGSSLGNGQQADGPLVTSNSRYGISAGLEPPSGANPGIDVRAGIAAVPSAEDPSGAPQATPPQIESTAPDNLGGTPGGYAAPLLETPGNPRLGVLGVDGPPLP